MSDENVNGPDFSICGTPLIEMLGHDRLDDHVERAAMLAIENPTVGICVGQWPSDAEYSRDAEQMVRRQREHLRAWRATTAAKGDGTLKLRTRTKVEAAENATTLLYVQLTPARKRAKTVHVIEAETDA